MRDVEGKEHAGGFTTITALDLDVALEWAQGLAIAMGGNAAERRYLQDRLRNLS